MAEAQGGLAPLQYQGVLRWGKQPAWPEPPRALLPAGPTRDALEEVGEILEELEAQLRQEARLGLVEKDHDLHRIEAALLCVGSPAPRAEEGWKECTLPPSGRGAAGTHASA
jgi:hypothetical protein